MNKSLKLLKLIDSINIRKKFTIKELADEFSVSYKTMWRYLKELEEMGVPLYSEQGVHGGFSIINEFKKPSISQKKNTMSSNTSCKIVHKGTLKFIGYSFTAPYSAFGEVEILAPRLWIRLMQRIHEISNCTNMSQRIGVAHNRADDFTYYLTVEVDEVQQVPEGMTSLIIDSRRYAEFIHKGNMERDSVQASYRSAYEWLNAYGYNLDNEAFSLELYDDKFRPTMKDNQFTVFLPIK